MKVEPTGELRQRQPRREEPRHLQFIRSLVCSVVGCQRGPIHAAHIRAGSIPWGKRAVGVGEKPDDRWTVPLCAHHHLVGQHGENEMAWWRKQGRDPFALAAALYECSPRDLFSGREIAAGRMTAKVPF